MLFELMELMATNPVGGAPPTAVNNEIVEPVAQITQSDESESSETIIVRTKRISKPYANVTFKKLDVYFNPSAKADALLAVSDLQFSTNNNNSAEVILRGGSPRLSRTYFNDVPIYEIVRGTNFVSTSAGFSIFNTSTIDEVETYSAAPPSYFAGSAGGVVRILPQSDAHDEGEIGINLTKAYFNFTRANSNSDKGFVQFYADYSNLEPLLRVNSNLRTNVVSSNGMDIGMNALYRPWDNGEFRVLSVFDTEDGEYKADAFDPNNHVINKKHRNYNIVSYEHGMGKSRLKIDLAKTYVDQATKINNNNFVSKNEYSYFDVNLAGRGSNLPFSYRIGAGGEEIRLRTDALIKIPKFDFLDKYTRLERANYFAYYGFLTYSVNKNLNIALGGRDYFKNNPELKPTAQMSISFQDDESRHNIIFSSGQYGAILMPKRSAFDGISAASSRQSAIDYRFKDGENSLSFGIYQKIENLEGRRETINGFDAGFSFDIFERLQLSGNFARSLPYYFSNQNKQRGDSHLDYLIKLKAKIKIAQMQFLNFSYTNMSGSVYSLPDSIGTNQFGENAPIYKIRNTEQMGNYQSLDVNYITQLKIPNLEIRPILYVNVSNVLDKDNAAGISYNSDFSQSKFNNYIGRTFVVGMIFGF